MSLRADFLSCTILIAFVDGNGILSVMEFRAHFFIVLFEDTIDSGKGKMLFTMKIDFFFFLEYRFDLFMEKKLIYRVIYCVRVLFNRVVQRLK